MAANVTGRPLRRASAAAASSENALMSIPTPGRPVIRDRLNRCRPSQHPISRTGASAGCDASHTLSPIFR